MDDTDLLGFWKICRPNVYVQCCRLLRDQAAAEDAAQETFLRVQRHFSRIPRKLQEALAWVYRVTKNCCLNEIRNRGRRPEPRAEIPEDTGSGTSPGHGRFDRSTETLANRQLVERLIEQIPDKLSSVAWLYHVDEMNQQEVADTLGISRRTVVDRLARFSEDSRQLLQQLDRGGGPLGVSRAPDRTHRLSSPKRIDHE